MTASRAPRIARVAVALAVGVALALAAGLAGVVAADRDPATSWSPVVYPEQRLPLVFSHARHLARGTGCLVCHPGAASSQSAVDNLLPTERECRACHPIDRGQPDLVVPGAPPAACRACHPGYRAGMPVARLYLTPPPLKFSHSAHRGQTEQSCASCHGDLRAVDLATTQQLPTMASCLACHKEGNQAARCADCHLARRGGLLETRFDHGALVPAHTGLGDGHGPGFATDHTQEARQIGATCAACHDTSECVACHQGVTKPAEFHPGNYVLGHVVEARRGTPDCGACHRAQSFCIGCHERSGIGKRGDGQFTGVDPARAFHPPGWASPSGANGAGGATGNRHALEARRNITSCASCHREDDCLACHSAEPGGLRASPHPPGWRGSARCKALDRGNRRMCLRCHVRAEELGCDWSAPR